MTQLFDQRVINPAIFQPDGPENGVFAFGPVNVPIGTASIDGRVLRAGPGSNRIETYPANFTVVVYQIDISRDNGTTWYKIVDLVVLGGVLDRFGTHVTENHFKTWNKYLLSEENPADANTLVRGQIKVYATCRTETWATGYDNNEGN